MYPSNILTSTYQRVVVLKDKQNKKAHEASAQLACEAAGAIRTVASLTREKDCCEIYARSLEKPLENAKKAAMWSNLLWATSQSMTFYVMGLVFWYGSRLVADREFSPFHFFVTLMVCAVFSAVSGLDPDCVFSEHDLRRYASRKRLPVRPRHVLSQ